MDINKKLSKWYILGLIIFSLIYIGILISLPTGVNLDMDLFLVGILICSLIAMPIAVFNNENLRLHVNAVVWLLCVGIFTMIWFLIQSVLVIHINGEKKIYEQEIKYVTKLKGAKQGSGCKIFAQWKDKQSNNWLEYCVSNDIYESFLEKKVLNASIQSKQNDFGVLIEKITFDLDKK